MRTGILGGTFDPVHYGHLLMGEICRQTLGLDIVRFIPARQPPHKPGRQITNGNMRADMLTLAVSGYPEFFVDRRELHRDGPSYTVDTLTDLSSELPDSQLFLLIGADSLRDLLSWRDPVRISQLARIVVCNRPGLPLPTREQAALWVGDEIAETIQFIPMPGTDLSASELRNRVHAGLGLRFMTPRSVSAYIEQNGLYR